MNFKNRINFGRLEIIVFLCGAVVMILELIGSRILAPYLGTSIFVWTALIGIILGALSLGYYLGGKISLKNPNFKTLAGIIFTGGLLIFLITLIKSPILNYCMGFGVRLGSVLATLILFGPPSVFLGMVSPYAIRLKIKNLESSGKVAGNLYALSTIGSIFGTFLAGFYLIPNFGSTNILFVLSLVLIFTSFLCHFPFHKIGFFFLIFLVISSIWVIFLNLPSKYLIEKDSAYNHIQVMDVGDKKTGLTMRLLLLGKMTHGAMFLESDNLAMEYLNFYRLDFLFNPKIKKSLIIGGGAYVAVQDFLKRFPAAQIDVVEIDPQITKVAYKYFNLKDNPRLKIYHQDGRTFLNQNKNEYDVIYGDAFASFYAVPFQLTTLEAVKKIYDSLTDDGIVLINIISALEGKKSLFFQAEYKTFAQIFPQVYVFPVHFTEKDKQDKVQNIILIATKNHKRLSPEELKIMANFNQRELLKNLWLKEPKMADFPVLTDDFAPVDYYISKML